MCDWPRPLKPTTATRRSLFEPGAAAWIFAGSETAAAAAAVRLRKERRVVCMDRGGIKKVGRRLKSRRGKWSRSPGKFGEALGGLGLGGIAFVNVDAILESDLAAG